MKKLLMLLISVSTRTIKGILIEIGKGIIYGKKEESTIVEVIN